MNNISRVEVASGKGGKFLACDGAYLRIDGVDQKSVRSVELRMQAGEISRAIVEYVPDQVFAGEAQVIKRVRIGDELYEVKKIDPG